MKRVMVNLDLESGKFLEDRAAVQKRSVSSYVALLIEQDLRAAGLLPENQMKDDQRFWEKVRAAAQRNPKLKQRITVSVQQSERERLGK
jgi:hypothetical protein